MPTAAAPKSRLLTNAEQAAVEVMHMACIDAIRNPGLLDSEHYFSYRLGTAGHFYEIQGLTEIVAENVRYREALEEIVRRCEVGGLYRLIDVPRKALNPDGGS